MTAPPLNRLLLAGLLLALGLAACAPDAGPVATPTPFSTPTETPIPAALTVNGESISRDEFDAEVSRYLASQAARGKTVAPEAAAEAVRNDLIDTLLLAQGAAAAGYTVDDAALQARLDALAAQAGGPQALAEWQAAHGYTEAGFRAALRRQMAAAWMRDRIAASLPAEAEQVHVKQILLYNADAAGQVWAQLQAGADFETLAARYDPLTRGELGWLPRGYLLEPAVETAAFALQPGEYSPIVQSGAGYHILFLVERDPARPLSPDARLTLQRKALAEWLARQRAQSVIVIGP